MIRGLLQAGALGGAVAALALSLLPGGPGTPPASPAGPASPVAASPRPATAATPPVRGSSADAGDARGGPDREGGDLGDLFGLTGSVNFPLALEGRAPPEQVTGRLERMARKAASIGARWSRGHTLGMPRLSYDRWLREGGSWARADAWVRIQQAVGLDLVMMVGPWPGNRTSRFTDTFELADPRGYQRFVRAAVERYDGDGVDDMPGLRRGIHHWEVDNEPDLKHFGLRGHPPPPDFCTPEQFGRLLVLTARAIRQADPAAVVLNGGMAFPHEERGGAYMRELFREDGVLEAIDAVSVHVYHKGPGLEAVRRALANARAAAPGRPVWITETSVPSRALHPDRHPWIDPSWQAEMLVQTYLLALEEGVPHVFWHRLADVVDGSTRRPGGGITPLGLSNSLFSTERDGSLTPKPSAAAWKRMVRLLEGVPRESLRPLRVGGGHGIAIGDGRAIVAGSGAVQVPLPATRATRIATGGAVPLERVGEGVRVDVGRGAVLLEVSP